MAPGTSCSTVSPSFDSATETSDWASFAPENSVSDTLSVSPDRNTRGVTSGERAPSDVDVVTADSTLPAAVRRCGTGDVVVRGVCNSYLRTDGPLIAVIGLEDVVIVVNADTVLAVAKDRVQEVGKLAEELRSEGRSEPLVHQRVHDEVQHLQSARVGPEEAKDAVDATGRSIASAIL